MAKGNLIIGCGGTGKGVLNYVKDTLIRRYGSLQAAGTVLLAIDGPSPESDGDYIPPNGITLSSQAGSPEFFGLSQNPKTIITAISQNASDSSPAFPFIASAINRNEAADLLAKVTNWSPPQGMGGCRPVGHSNLIMEATSLENRLKNALSDAGTFRQQITLEDGRQMAQLNVYLVGGQFGGTGAGQLIDVAQLVRRNLNNENGDRLILVVVLPDAYANIVSRDPDLKRYSYAKAGCGLLEAARSRKSLGIMDTMEYAQHINVKYSGLFDMCFLIDGKAAGHNLSQLQPMKGVVPEIADTIASLVIDDQYTPGKFVNWIAQETVLKHYSTVGSHIWHFPAERTVRDFALRFTLEVYDRLLDQTGADTQAKQRYDSLMQFTARFTQLALDLENNKRLPTDPDEWKVLRPGLSLTVPAVIWPDTPGYDALFFPKTVKRCGLILGPTDADVMQDTDWQFDDYLGDKNDVVDTSVYGWINANNREVQHAFANKLFEAIRDIFYEQDPETGQLAPRKLSQQANTIIEAQICLQRIMTGLETLKQQFIEDLKQKTQKPDTQNPGQVAPLTRLRKNEVDALRPHMGAGRNRSQQDEFVNVSQAYLQACIWEILMEGGRKLAGDLLELTKVCWGWIGEASTGWINFMDLVCRKSVSDAQAELRNVAIEEDGRNQNGRLAGGIVCRTSYPRVGSPAEKMMYKDVTREIGLVETALKNLAWELSVTSPIVEGVNPKDELEKRSIRMRTSIPKPPHTDSWEVVSRDLITSDTRRTQESYHSPEMLLRFGENEIKPIVMGKSIWDALYYVYTYGWKEKHGGSLDDFVQDRVNRLQQRSGCLFANIGARQPEYFLLTHFMSKDSNEGKLSETFQSQLAATFGSKAISDLPQLTKELRLLSIMHGLDITEWGEFSNAMSDYFAHETAGVLPTVHIYPNEKYALKLENIIASKVLRAAPCPLPPETTCLMNRPDVLEGFVLGYLAGVFDPIDDPRYPNTFPNVGVLTELVTVDLGMKSSLDQVMRKFMTYIGPLEHDALLARNEVTSRVNAKLQTLTTVAAQEAFFRQLYTQIDAPDLFTANPTQGVPWNEWRNIFKAVVINCAGKYKITLP